MSFAGYTLIISGLMHLAVWFFTGTSWEGDLSYRKPALFGISGGLTLVSMHYLLRIVDGLRFQTLLAATLTTAMSIEVALITFQQWRGVASHFNHTTEFNAVVDFAITILILIVTVCIALIGYRAFNTPLLTSRDYQFAWRAGLVLLALSCVIGIAILAYGEFRIRIGEDPTIFGKAGVTKFPHGMAIHAIQILPATCWLLSQFGISIDVRLKQMRLITAAFGCALAFSLMQTLSGRERSDLTIASGCLLVIAVGLTVPLLYLACDGAATALRGKYQRRRDAL